MAADFSSRHRMFIGRAEWSLVWLAVALLSIGPNWAAADDVSISAADMSAYGDAPHFKALAASLPVAIGTPLVRYSFNYDTPRHAVRAALAYCEEARLLEGDPSERASCKLVWIGTHAVESLDEDRRNGILDRYEEETIARLYRTLEITNDGAVRISLATILQKSGHFEQSEALLADLASAGDKLARNALAYHWAELNIHLERALAYADGAIASQPDIASFHDTRALVLYRLGRLDDALAAADHAVSLNPHPIVLDHYGDILWSAMRCRDAISAWQRALSYSEDILFRQRVARKIASGPDGPPVFE